MDVQYYIRLLVPIALFLSACTETTAPPVEKPDSVAVQANNRAVGLMGRFEYEQARDQFDAIVEQWPEWNDARVNLAIATLNRQAEGDEARALEIAQAVLRDDPDHLRARYVTGLVHLYLGEAAKARDSFQAVVNADPNDAFAAYYLAQCKAQLGDYEKALPEFRRALALNPYLRSAYYGAFQALQRLGRSDEASALAADYQRLEGNPRSQLAEFKYTRMGPRGAALAVDNGGGGDAAMPLPEGELFMPPIPLPVDGSLPQRWARPLPGRQSSLTTADIQNDGWPDLVITGVVPLGGDGPAERAGNLVLAGGEGDRFSVMSDQPFSGVDNVNAVLWGDFDNDGRVDAFLCRRGANQLWRQTPDGWEDVTSASGTAGPDLDTVDGAFFDADHDGDLDLFLVNADGPNQLLNNNLDGTFRPLAADYGLAGTGAASLSVVPVDLDNDRDADLVVINRDPPHEVYLNDRLWSYRSAEGFGPFIERPARAALAADIDADGWVELYTVDETGAILRWPAGPDQPVEAEQLAGPDILRGGDPVQLAAVDVDGDGTLELLTSSARGWVVFKAEAEGWQELYSATAAEGAALVGTMPLIGASTNGPALLGLSPAAGGLTLWRPGNGRHPFLTATLSGREDDAQSMRSNASGIGARLTVRFGTNWSLLHGYRNHSGPGQSLQPLAIGLGGAERADFVAIDWSDGVFQSEVDVETGQLHRIEETQRQLSSCPVLFAWNGSEHVFVSDFLGVGGMGYAIGPGEYTTPRPWENFQLPEGLLQARNGRYEIKIGEPMEENAYIDAVRLAVYDLPPGWQMVMDERMGLAAPEPTGEPRFYRAEVLPSDAASNHADKLLDTVTESDGRAAPVGPLDTRFIGRLQGEHVLTLMFPQALDTVPGDAMLLIDGWVEYPYSQTNFAAWQAGATYDAPTLEAYANGQWHVIAEQFGYPAGMPRRMSLPMKNLPAGTQKLRLRTNMQIYWDRISVAYAEPLPNFVKYDLPLTAARLSKPGFALRTTLDQHRPHYDYSKLSPFWDTRYMAGLYTRFGPVEELVAVRDDAVAIIGPGEEVHLEFSEARPPREGWRRYFVLETKGWAKDKDLFTRDGETVGPLPSSGMPAGPRDALHARYNTRYRSGF